MGVMGLAMLIYVVLDGYDLGVGILLPWAEDSEKDTMISSIGPFWDANETWLVLGVGVLLVAFPKAHGVVLTALYVPVTLMLIGLILRGVAFDFRVKVDTVYKSIWNRIFTAGSLITSLCQGWMLGAYITGFSSHPMSWVFNTIVAVTLPFSYTLLASGWLLMKTDGALFAKAQRFGKLSIWPMALGIVLISAVTPLVAPQVFAKWFSFPALLLLAPIPLLTMWCFVQAYRQLLQTNLLVSGEGWKVFAYAAGVLFLSFAGLAYSQFPYIVPGQLTALEAASATGSLKIILVGVVITLPTILAYTVFAYKVFWGKTRMLSY